MHMDVPDSLKIHLSLQTQVYKGLLKARTTESRKIILHLSGEGGDLLGGTRYQKIL